MMYPVPVSKRKAGYFVVIGILVGFNTLALNKGRQTSLFSAICRSAVDSPWKLETDDNLRSVSRQHANENLIELSKDAITTNNNRQLYTAGPLESYFRDNHYNASGTEGKIFFQRGCPIWREETASPKYHDLQVYIKQLREYMVAVERFNISVNLRDEMFRRGPAARDEICSMVEVHPAGLRGIFTTGQLSYSPQMGYMEPLLPPLRHPLMCYDNPDIYHYHLAAKRLLDLSYIVHDFGALCRRLRPDSRVILIDMGASLQFHDSFKQKSLPPAVYLTETFRRFGLPFDHIYAYEITPTEPDTMVKSVPENLRAAYHWINVGVDPDVNSANNPFNLILNHYNEHDIVIVKLDIDNDRIELEFVQQLLQDERFHVTANGSARNNTDGASSGLIDHFYFEHHLGGPHERTESIQLFSKLREKGIPAHYWV